jgi:hypothetical protein
MFTHTEWLNQTQVDEWLRSFGGTVAFQERNNGFHYARRTHRRYHFCYTRALPGVKETNHPRSDIVQKMQFPLSVLAPSADCLQD